MKSTANRSSSTGSTGVSDSKKLHLYKGRECRVSSTLAAATHFDVDGGLTFEDSLFGVGNSRTLRRLRQHDDQQGVEC